MIPKTGANVRPVHKTRLEIFSLSFEFKLMTQLNSTILAISYFHVAKRKIQFPIKKNLKIYCFVVLNDCGLQSRSK